MAIIGTAGYARSYLSLNRYTGKERMLRVAGELRAHGNYRYTYKGIQMAGTMLQRDSTKERQKIVVVLTNGRSKAARTWSGGYTLQSSKQEAIKLRRLGAIVISASMVPYGYDITQLREMASHPKPMYALHAPKIYSLVDQVTSRIRMSLMKCKFLQFFHYLSMKVISFYIADRNRNLLDSENKSCFRTL